MLPEVVTEKLRALPANPGVYLFRDKKGNVLYVGKAKSLRSRVRSYFQSGSSDTRSFIPILMRTIGDLDTIVTGTEKEAAILENTLIKEHRPRYNVKLRDDKEYLSIRLNVNHAWPRLDVVRRPAQDNAEYYGPYHSATAARRTLHLINKHFQLRTCSDLELESRRRPCLQYQIKRCPAPCVHEVDKSWYGEQVRAVSLFLQGRHDELSKLLKDQMRSAAAALRFELAAVYRDQLRAIEKVRESQRVVTPETIDQDVIGIYREGDLVELAVLYVRGGKLAEVGAFSIKHAEIPDDEIVGAFLSQHYGGGLLAVGSPDAPPKAAAETAADANADTDSDRAIELEVLPAIPIPKEIVLPCLPEGHEGIGEWLSDAARSKVSLLHPKRGPRAHLLSMANENARHSFLEKQRVSDGVQERLAQLQERLRLPTMPHRIECCDISHLGGGDTVGAVVAMKDGLPDKKRYRTFHVRGTRGKVAMGDDYAAMYEVLARRFRRGILRAQSGEVEAAAEGNLSAASDATRDAPSGDGGAGAGANSGPGDWELPDLFVVDGGRGQLGVALAASRDLGLHTLSIVALAKEKENVMGETLVDRVYLPGQKNPIALKTHSASLFLLARLRDEAHRFSNRARERLGKARRFHSALDDVRGIGPATKKALLKALGTVDAIVQADDASLLAVSGVTKRHVDALRRAFPKKDEGVSSSGPLPPPSTEGIP